MKTKKNIFLLSLFLSLPLLCSDNNTNTNQAKTLPFEALSQITDTIGYQTAKNIQTWAVKKSVYDIYHKITTCPPDIQRIITTHPLFYETYQNIYLKSFRKAKTNLVQKKFYCATNLSAINDDTIAITQPESFVEIWSIKNNGKIFTSGQLTSQANTYIKPLLISSSPETSLYTWNIENNYEHNYIPTNHTQCISLIFPGPNSLISCNEIGIICIHDPQYFATQRIITAHDGQIFTGKTISKNNFITGSLDNWIKEWDTRTNDPVNTHKFSYYFIPYGIHCADENYLIISGTEKNIYILDRRQNLEVVQLLKASEAFDIQSLQDKTIVFGKKTLHFTTWNNNTLIEKYSIPISDPIQTMITTPNDTIVYTNSKSDVFYIKPTTRPLHLIQDASIENAIIALNINESNYSTN